MATTAPKRPMVGRDWAVTKQATLDTTPPRKLPRRMRLNMLLDLIEYRLYEQVLPRIERAVDGSPNEDRLYTQMDALDDRIAAVEDAIDAMPKRRIHPKPKAVSA